MLLKNHRPYSRQRRRKGDVHAVRQKIFDGYEKTAHGRIYHRGTRSRQQRLRTDHQKNSIAGELRCISDACFFGIQHC